MGKGTSAGNVGYSSGCAIVPRSGKAAGTQIPGVQRLTTTSGTLRRGSGQVTVVCEPGHGQCSAHTLANISSILRCFPGGIPNDCFPETDVPAVTTTSRQVTFAPIIQATMEVTHPKVTDVDFPPTDECTVAIWTPRVDRQN